MKTIATLLLTLTLAACGDGGVASRADADPRLEAARRAAEAALGQRVRTPEQRGVQVFTQAVAETVAVCGRARGSANAVYLPYVAVISLDGGEARVASFQMGSTGAEASRVFIEMVDRCFDGGGPATARAVARATPPLPNNAAPETAAAAEPAVAATEPAPAGSRMATARGGANIRSAPRGGEVVRSLPNGGSMAVMGEAPGGWYQVGERGAAVGWVHSSVVEVSTAPLQVAERR